VDENKVLWVALNLVLSTNLRAAKKTVEYFPNLRDIFRASPNDLVALGLKEDEAQELTSPGLVERASRVLSKAQKEGCRVFTLDDQEYPESLREIFDPPFVLYCAGRPEVLKDPAVSIVGSRTPSPYGRAVAERLAQDLAALGLVVVSGMARGIDSISHWGALKAGKTVAVLGSGLENIYPKENRALFRKIVAVGAVISELPPDSPPLKHHFPLRNRIISGLSLGVVVVEASRKSGSLITARLGLEQNREVMAVPGNVTSDLSLGANWLIKSGAKLVETWEDVVEELPCPLRESLFSRKKQEKKTMPEMSPAEKKLFDGLKPDELTHIDELVEQSDASISEILALLLNLELKGLIYQAPGKYFQRSL